MDCAVLILVSLLVLWFVAGGRVSDTYVSAAPTVSNALAANADEVVPDLIAEAHGVLGRAAVVEGSPRPYAPAPGAPHPADLFYTGTYDRAGTCEDASPPLALTFDDGLPSNWALPDAGGPLPPVPPADPRPPSTPWFTGTLGTRRRVTMASPAIAGALSDASRMAPPQDPPVPTDPVPVIFAPDHEPLTA